MDPKAPAFGTDGRICNGHFIPAGITVRDHIAIEAMKAIIGKRPEWHYNKVAEEAYLFANALIAESNKKN